jgi:hypothetical protein
MQTQADTSFEFVHLLLKRVMAITLGWRKLMGEPYRPEKHYMRGPGPKWREKYAAATHRSPAPRAVASRGRRPGREG